ncbi:hypothetical protein [Sphingomonas sp.]|uniref:hypothetical protein n=1 Tax=Sphingomonas sp. TaxID=28214 RepID=UPI003AFFA296
MDGGTGTTLLRRYTIVGDEWEAFLDVWRRIVAVRKRHGFEVLFALVDREENIFTWAIRHPGDIDAAAEVYYKDPERIELEIVGRYVTDWSVSTVTQEPIP